MPKAEQRANEALKLQEIPWRRMPGNSKSISKVYFDEQTEHIYVRFYGKDSDPNGTAYVYFDAGEQRYRDFVEFASKRSYANGVLAVQCDYCKVVDVPDLQTALADSLSKLPSEVA